jgi:hypothetical protein
MELFVEAEPTPLACCPPVKFKRKGGSDFTVLNSAQSFFEARNRSVDFE